MNTILLQLWEISNTDNSILPDGCSLHTTMTNRNSFIKSVNESNERIVGLPSEVEVSDAIFDIIIKKNNIRLSEIEFNNLVGLKEILPL